MGEKNEDNKNVKKEKVLFPISFKLITIFSILTIAVLALTTFMVSTLVRSDEQLKAEENNHTINGRTAQTIQQTILNKQSDATGFISMIDLISDDSQQAEKIKTAFNDFCTRNPEKVFDREKLLNLVWGYEYPGDLRTVDVHIRRLREKVEPNPSEPCYVQTKWGVGYYYHSV